jgi:hypothetical protein
MSKLSVPQEIMNGSLPLAGTAANIPSGTLNSSNLMCTTWTTKSNLTYGMKIKERKMFVSEMELLSAADLLNAKVIIGLILSLKVKEQVNFWLNLLGLSILTMQKSLQDKKRNLRVSLAKKKN